MDFRKSATTAIVIGFVGGAFLLGGVLMGGSSSKASTQVVAPKTQTPFVTVTATAGGLTVGTAVPSTEDKTETGGEGSGTLVPVNQPNGGGDNGGGNPGPQQPQPQQPEPVAPVQPEQPAPQPPVIEPEPEPEEPVVLVVPPTIEKTTPVDNSTGNTRGTKLLFYFSRPMDKASVNAAFTMVSPVVNGTISWDVAGEVMTFDPAADFAYGEWVEAKIGGTAKDAMGVEMFHDKTIKFRVMRIATVDLLSVAGKDGYVVNPQVAAIDYVNTEANRIKVSTWERGFLSFNLASLPENVIDVTDAELSVLQSSADATAYGGQTGNLRVQPLPFASLDVSDFNKKGIEVCWPICAPVSQLLSSSQGLGMKTADMTLFLRADVKNRVELGNLSQFRLFFDKENGGDGPKVGVEIHSGEGATKPKLQITYTYH